MMAHAHISALPPHVAISDARVYATQGRIYTLDRQQGTLLQSYPIKGVHASIVQNEVLYANVAYVQGQAIQAFQTNDGTQLWSYPALQLTEAPILVNGILYASDIGKGCVYAIQAHTGTLLWSYQTGKSLYTLPTVAGGVVYLTPATSSPGQAYVYALRARHGSQLWRAPIPEASNVPIVAADGIIYVCTHRRCYALQGWDGSPIWQYEYAPEGATPTHPVEKDGVLYIGGTVLSRPVLQENVLYFCLHSVGYLQTSAQTPRKYPQHMQHTLYLCALDLKARGLLWQRHFSEIPNHVPLTRTPETLTAGSDGNIYLSGTDGVFYAIDTHNGRTLWSYQTAGKTLSSAALADTIAYVGSNDGHVYALDTTTGQLLWKSFVSTGTTTSGPSQQTVSGKP